MPASAGSGRGGGLRSAGGGGRRDGSGGQRLAPAPPPGAAGAGAAGAGAAGAGGPRRGGGQPGPGRAGGTGRRKGPVRDAEAGLAEVMSVPAIWRDAGGRLLELPGPGSGIVVCGALPGTDAPVPAWTAGRLAAAGVAQVPGPVRDGTGLGLASAVLTPALLDEALAGTPARRSRKVTPRLAMQVRLARALMPGTAAATLRMLAQRPRETDPGYDLPAASSLSDADSFLQVKPFLRLLAGLCGQVRAVPLPGLPPACLPADGDRAPSRLRPLAGGPWHDGRWHGLRILAKDGTVRTVADPKGSDRKRTGGQSRNAAHLGRPASTGKPADPQLRMVEVTDVWARAAVAWAAGPCGIGETTLAPHLEPAYGPGDLDLADRGFPSREAIAAKISTGRHFAWRVSAAWNLRRSGRPLPDGTWKANITWHGRTYKVRVIEYHIDQVFDLPPGHPLLTAPPAGPSVRVLHDGDGDTGLCRRPDGTIRVEVSETVTIITSLMDTAAYPARDIADLYGLRWAAELVYLEEKQTLAGGQPITAATPAGAYRTAIATVAAHQALRITGAAIAAAAGAEPARISATALRDAVTASIGAGQGATTPALTAAIGIIRRDLTAHPLRFVTAWRPGRHYPRFTIKKIRTRKSNDIVPAATRLHLLPLPATPGPQQPGAPPAA